MVSGDFLLYCVVALVIIVCSFMAVTSRKILRSATYLLFVLLATAVIYFQLGYQFLGAVQIAVYAGGILILFVFSILLTSRPGDNEELLKSRRKIAGVFAAIAGAGILGYALYSGFPLLGGASLKVALNTADPQMETIGTTLLSSDKFGYLLPFEAISILLLACIIGSLVIARKR